MSSRDSFIEELIRRNYRANRIAAFGLYMLAYRVRNGNRTFVGPCVTGEVA